MLKKSCKKQITRFYFVTPITCQLGLILRRKTISLHLVIKMTEASRLFWFSNCKQFTYLEKQSHSSLFIAYEGTDVRYCTRRWYSASPRLQKFPRSGNVMMGHPSRDLPPTTHKNQSTCTISNTCIHSYPG